MVELRCSDCGDPITRKSKTGRCHPCAMSIVSQGNKERRRQELGIGDPRDEVYGHPTTLEYWNQHMDRKLHRDFGLESPLLDVGCGTGEKAILWTMDGWEVAGFDISTWCIKKASEHKIANSIRGCVDFVQADVTQLWPYQENAFCSLVCTDVLEHIWGFDETHFFSEALRVVVPGGKVLIVVPHGDAYYEKRHLRFFEVEDAWRLGNYYLHDHHVEVRDDRLYLAGCV